MAISMPVRANMILSPFPCYKVLFQQRNGTVYAITFVITSKSKMMSRYISII